MLKRLPVILVPFTLLACGQVETEVPSPPPVSAPEPTVEVADQPPPPLEVRGVTTLVDESPEPDVVEVSLTAGVTQVTIDGKVVEAYTYNGQFPGPLLEARQGQRIIVHFTNALPEPTTIHWHGLRIPAEMDGSPRIQSPVKPGETFTYDFVAPDAGSFWYHPHVRTNEQIEKGLYGPMIIREPQDPRVTRERFLLLDDVLLTSGGDFAPFLQSNMEAMHGRLGNTLLTNGLVNGQGLEDVVRSGERERWRIVNTSNARTMVLTLEGAEFQVVGTDGGLLPQPYSTERLEIAVGQRYDLEVIYFAPGEVKLQSWVLTRNSSGDVVEVPVTVFTVEAAAEVVNAAPVEWKGAPLPDRAEDETVTITIDAVNDPQLGIMWRLNGEAHSHTPLFTFPEGRTVRLRLSNTLGPEHPFHLHGQFFRIADAGGGRASPPGLKDTVLVPGFTDVEIVAYMDNPGRWMAHCHILEHAELGMMSELVVEPKQ